MNKLNVDNIEFIDHSIEHLLHKTNSFEKNYFFSKLKNKGIKKIIFIVKHFDKDLEHFSIKCIQHNLNIIVLFASSLENNLDTLWDYIQRNEIVMLLFSQHCQNLKEKIVELVGFDPVKDDFIYESSKSDILIEESSINHDGFYKKNISMIQHPNQSKITVQGETKNQDEFAPQAVNNEIDQMSIESLNYDNSLSSDSSTTFETSVSNENTTLIIEDLRSKEVDDNNKIQEKQEKKEEDLKNEFEKNELTLERKATSGEPTQNTQTIQTTQETKTQEEPSKKITTISSPYVKKETKEFKPSKLTIRTKLLSITIMLITFSLSLMIFFASYFFKRDIETQIQTNNSNTVNIISQKIEDLIYQFYFDSDLILKSMSNNQFIISLSSFENPYILAIASISPIYNDFKISKWYTNDILMQQNALIIQDFEKTISIYKDDISLSLTGIYNIINISPNFNLPILLLIAPIKNSPGELLLIFINGKKLINDLPVDENTKTFVVNRNGNVLIYPDIEIVQLAPNLKDIPIVQMMLESKLDNGLTTFNYKNKDYLGAFRKISTASIGILSITEAKKAFEPVYATQRRNFYILGIVLVIAIVIVYFFSKSISQPIKELAIATERVEEEDYSVRVKPKSRDEIGLLAYSFNKMVKGLEERERMKDAFGRFVNKEVAEKALKGEIKLGGEKKECAVFFSDLRGFTAMSEKMKPEEVVEYLNRYFTLMVDCVEKTHGIVDKFIGDAVMATWGAVTHYGNDAENAVNGALLMRKALIEFNKYNIEHNHPVAKFGCGINYGEVISGQIGSEKRLEFTVIGDAVNLASRIEALNKPFATDILISQDLYEKVKDIFDVVKMPAIKVKGKSEPQTIYCVLGRKDDPTRPKSLQELRKLVGIDWEPQISEDSEIFGEDKEEKYEILKKDGSKK